MELILINSVRKIGKLGDIIKVKNGYGRNFLIPQKLAIRATEQNKEFFEKQRKSLEQKNQELYFKAKETAALLNGKELAFVRQASEDGKLFGSVNNKEIAHSLSELIGEPINHSQIHLNNIIKYVGLYDIEVVLHAEQIVNIKLAVSRTEADARALLKVSDSDEIIDIDLNVDDEDNGAKTTNEGEVK